MPTVHARASFAANLYNIFITILDSIAQFSGNADFLQQKKQTGVFLLHQK